MPGQKHLTAQQITHEYLYGKNNQNISMDKMAYMQGPGRFANPSQIKIIEAFMNPWMYPISNQIPPGEYTKDQMRKIMGMPNFPENTHSYHQAWYGDHISDRMERTYIWGSSKIKINDEAKFIVENNGNRYIKNFALEPMKDNFDFQGNWLSNLANGYLESKLDPHRIGKTVQLNFSSKDVLPTSTFTYQDFTRARAMRQQPDPTFEDVSITEILNFIEQLSLRMRQYSSNLDNRSALERLVNNPKFANLSKEDQEKGIQIAQAKDEQQTVEQAAYHTPQPIWL